MLKWRCLRIKCERSMYQVEQHQIKPNHLWFEYCEQTCLASKNLFNTAQYSNRQSFFYGYGSISQGVMDKLFRDNENYQVLPAKVSQLVLKQVQDTWQSYFKAIKAWKLDHSKFTGRPKAPAYIEAGEKGRNLVKFNIQAISKAQFKKGRLVPSLSPIAIPVKPGLEYKNLVEVRIVPRVGCYVVEVVYDDGIQANSSLEPGLAASIDIGIDNLAMITFSNPSITPIAINGKPLKSRNQWMNKELARLKSILKLGTSQKIQNIIRNRNNYVHTYLHQATARIVTLLVNIGVTHLAIGKNPQWKTAINIGKKNNQNFVQIPHAKFVTMLTQKLEKVGLNVKVGEESYTSLASFLDWDTIPIFVPVKSSSYKFSGKRIKTKKYRSSDGTIIHADVNGSLNIGRKVLPNFFDCLQSQVERNSGCVVAHPRRVNPFKMTKAKDLSGSAYI